jgi:hypothetical protein
LGLGLTLWKGTFEGWSDTWLRWCDREGNLLPTGEEQRERAEAAEARVGEQRERAEAAEARVGEQRERAEAAETQLREQRERAERLQARLRELGVED